MLTEPTMDKLHHMKLRAMADAFRVQLENPTMGTLSFEERFGMLVEAEYSKRRNALVERLVAKAGLKTREACIVENTAKMSHPRGVLEPLART